MGESSIFWLRVTLLLYSLGLWHALVTVIKRRQRLFNLALGAFSLGGVFHLVSIVDQGMAQGRFPVHSLHQMASLVGFLVTCTFLLVYWRYKYESLAVFVFPTVFLLTMVASLGTAVDLPAGYSLGGWWLTMHVVLVLLGYAALTLTFVAGVMYLIQEKELKSKRTASILLSIAPAGRSRRPRLPHPDGGFRSGNIGADFRQLLGFCRVGFELDCRPDDRAGLRDLGDLSGDGLQPVGNRLERP